jgi:predicted HTH domain antitoxin
MQIAIELPNDFVAFQAEPTIRKEITTSYALWLYQRERVTLAKAAELAGLDLYDFMQVCKDNRTPVIDISRTDLLEELSGFTPA